MNILKNRASLIFEYKVRMRRASGGWIKPLQPLPQGLLLTLDF